MNIRVIDDGALATIKEFEAVLGEIKDKKARLNPDAQSLVDDALEDIQKKVERLLKKRTTEESEVDKPELTPQEKELAEKLFIAIAVGRLARRLNLRVNRATEAKDGQGVDASPSDEPAGNADQALKSLKENQARGW